MCAAGLLLVASVAAMPDGRRATDSALDVGEIASEIASIATEARFAMLERKTTRQWKKTINKFKRAKRNGRRVGEVQSPRRTHREHRALTVRWCGAGPRFRAPPTWPDRERGSLGAREARYRHLHFPQKPPGWWHWHGGGHRGV